MVNEFLKDRSFHVEILGNKSESHQIPYGVPQGAVLSPTLYNIYTHDIPKCDQTTLALFADDTAFYASSKSNAKIMQALKKHAVSIHKFMVKWKIKVNKEKSQAIFVSNRYKRVPKGTIKLFDQDVNWSNESKYLGLILDKRMTLKNHIDYVIRKADIATKVLYPLINRKSRLCRKNKLSIYKLAIRPILTYATPAFPTISKCHMDRIQRFQNKSLRIILKRSRYERTIDIHKEANVPFIRDYIEKLVTKFNDKFMQ